MYVKIPPATGFRRITVHLAYALWVSAKIITRIASRIDHVAYLLYWAGATEERLRLEDTLRQGLMSELKALATPATKEFKQ